MYKTIDYGYYHYTMQSNNGLLQSFRKRYSTKPSCCSYYIIKTIATVVLSEKDSILPLSQYIIGDYQHLFLPVNIYEVVLVYKIDKNNY